MAPLCQFGGLWLGVMPSCKPGEQSRKCIWMLSVGASRNMYHDLITYTADQIMTLGAVM